MLGQAPDKCAVVFCTRISLRILIYCYYMEIHILDNSDDRIVKDHLISGLKVFSVFQAASAFIKQTGLNMIADILEERLKKNLIADIIVGLDFQITEPDALERLFCLKEQYPNFFLSCYRSDFGIAYHPKMYIFSNTETVYSIIGSSNLTGGGLTLNKEVNVEIKCQKSEELFTEINETFSRLKFDKNHRIPTKEYLELYRKHYKRYQRPAPKDKNVEYQFIEIENQLARPKVQAHDFNGWMKNVFDVLPDIPFKSRDIYQFKLHFQSLYPENQHIEAKIRQQLQFLRNIGLLKQIEDGYWVKTQNNTN